MTLAETQRVDKFRLSGKTPLEALAVLNRSRVLRDLPLVSRTAIYDYCAGKTHKRDHPETRGRRAVPLRNLKVYHAARRKLQKETDNEHVPKDSGAMCLPSKNGAASPPELSAADKEYSNRGTRRRRVSLGRGVPRVI